MWKPVGPDGQEYVGNESLMSQEQIAQVCQDIVAWAKTYDSKRDPSRWRWCLNCDAPYGNLSPLCPTAKAHEELSTVLKPYIN